MSAHHALVDRALDEQALLDRHLHRDMYRDYLGQYYGASYPEMDLDYLAKSLWKELVKASSQGECYAVSSDIGDLLTEAAPHIPRFALQLTDLPSPHGFVWLDGGIVLPDARGNDVVIRSITWTRVLMAHGEEQTSLPLPSDEVPPGGVKEGILFGYFSDMHDTRDAYSQGRDEQAKQMRVDIWDDPMTHRAYIGGLTLMFGEDPTEMAPSNMWVNFALAFFRFINEEYVAVERGTGSRQGQRRRQRAKLSTDVTLVRLRRSASPSTRSDDPQHREYDHRFVVHGHWRNQWYPSINDHRPKWIRAYVKGPEDAPLVVKREAFVVDR